LSLLFFFTLVAYGVTSSYVNKSLAIPLTFQWFSYTREALTVKRKVLNIKKQKPIPFENRLSLGHPLYPPPPNVPPLYQKNNRITIISTVRRLPTPRLRTGKQGVRHFLVLRFSLPNEPAPEVSPHGASSVEASGEGAPLNKPLRSRIEHSAERIGYPESKSMPEIFFSRVRVLQRSMRHISA
jgi:hypothetical protein